MSAALGPTCPQCQQQTLRITTRRKVRALYCHNCGAYFVGGRRLERVPTDERLTLTVISSAIDAEVGGQRT